MQALKRKRYQKDTAPPDDIVTLIHLVRQNPALYNYKLQPNQRRRIDILSGWAQIASQIGNKYTVEECRRKWKNLRDTYHQYRLRKPKFGDGLSKWRYAKDLEFLSNVYQPKLKANRGIEALNQAVTETLHEVASSHTDDDDDKVDNELVHHSSISLVNDVSETFILTQYDESVNGDDVVSIDRSSHDDPNMSHTMNLAHDDDVEDVEEIVKQEHSLDDDDDDDGAAGEVDYEEVCLYEEAANTSSVDCETIITGGSKSVSCISADSKAFDYDFCINAINTPSTSLSSAANVMTNAKLKNITMLTNTVCANNNAANTNSTNNCNNLNNTNNPTASSSVVTTVMTAPLTVTANNAFNNVTATDNGIATYTISQPIAHLPANANFSLARDELDLFFDFLKKKMQRFPKEDITAIQVEFLNCVLRRESAESELKNNLNATIKLQ